MKKLLFFTVISALIVIGTLFIPAEFNPLIEKENNTAKQQLNSYMQHVEIKRFNQQGQLDSTLSSQQLSQYLHNEDVLLETPVIRIREEDNNDWLLHADQGVNSAESGLYLSGNIVMQDSGGSTTISASELNFDQATGLAYSTKPILIKGEYFTTSASGIKIDFNHETIELTQDVKTTYQPVSDSAAKP